MRSVAITQRQLPVDGTGEQRDGLDIRWPRFLARCGMVAVPVPNDPALAPDFVATIQPAGLVLSGGDDLASCGGSRQAREQTEHLLLEWASAAGVPVIGVCRGMQILLEVFGSVLEQVDDHVRTRHDIRTDNGRRMVNSYHRWGVRHVRPPLTVVARAGDVVEAVRHRSLPLVGIMWHPEREADPDQRDVGLFTEMFGGRS
jgi:N5-(cytidine 5'-diphosphoramidyl)-L-glutamine hydrolase